MLIGCCFLSAGPTRGQEVEKLRGWVLDEKAATQGLERIPKADALRRSADRIELWKRAARQGPRLTPLLLDRRFDARSPSGLSILAALGLAGGPGASRALTQILESARAPELRVFAALAASRANLRVDPKALRRLATDSKREQVVRFAARISLICQGYGAGLEQALANLRESRDEVAFWRAMIRAMDPGAARRVVELPDEFPLGSFSECVARAVLLDAVRHPGVVPASVLEGLLRRGDRPNLRRLASLALGRLTTDREDLRLWMEQSPGLDRSCYFAGLDRLPGELVDLLRQGPGRARNEEWQRRFRAAAARLLPASDLRGLVTELLSLDASASRPARIALLRRVLVDGVALELDDASTGQLRALPGRAGVLLAVVARKASVKREEEATLGPRLATALRLWRRERLGADARAGQRILWRLFCVEEGLSSADGPGSPTQVFLDEYATLVRDVFVAASNSSGREKVFLPEGVRLARKDYFEILGSWLNDWPIPSRVPPRRE